MIRIAIAEEHEIPRWALRYALAAVPGLEVVGEAGTVTETVAMLRSIKPDVLILDTTMPDHTGFDVLAEIRNLEDGPLVVVLAPHDDASYAARAIAAGAHGYISKSAKPKDLIDAIEAVSRGEQIAPPGADRPISGGHPANALTHRELQVMEMLARGMTNREICTDLDISIKTVDTHRGHVLKKLRLRNNSELTRFAVKHGYVTL
jgi:DNA-binding NarL/FixJ family response regulator